MADMHARNHFDVRLSMAEAEALLADEDGSAARLIARQKVQRAMRLAGPPYVVHEGEKAVTVFEVATGDAAVTLLRRHLPDAYQRAQAFAAHLNENGRW